MLSWRPSRSRCEAGAIAVQKDIGSSHAPTRVADPALGVVLFAEEDSQPPVSCPDLSRHSRHGIAGSIGTALWERGRDLLVLRARNSPARSDSPHSVVVVPLVSGAYIFPPLHESRVASFFSASRF
jgi:hypothetical protein